MSHGAIAIAFASGSVLALVLLFVAVRRARAAGDLDASTALVLGSGLLVILPSAVVAVTGTLQRRTSVVGDLVAINPGWYHRLDQLCLALLAALALGLLLPHAAARTAPMHAAGLLAVLLWIVASLSAGLRGDSVVSARGLVLLLCLAAATVLPRGRGACIGAGIFTVVLAAAGGLLSLFRYDVAFIVPCQGACSGLGFTGVLPNENLLAIVVTAGIPLVVLGFRGPVRWLLAVFLAVTAVSTGSRTGAAGSIVLLAALVLVQPRLDERHPSRRRTAVAAATLAGAVAASVFVVRHHWSPTTLTTRPEIWGVAWRYIDRSPWFGYGPERWARLYDFSQIPIAAQRTTHNQWTDVLFVAGGVGVAVLVCMAAAAIWSAGRARSGVLLALASIATIGTTEGAWSIGTIDLMSFTLLAFVLIGETPAVGPHADEPGAGLARLRLPRTARPLY